MGICDLPERSREYLPDSLWKNTTFCTSHGRHGAPSSLGNSFEKDGVPSHVSVRVNPRPPHIQIVCSCWKLWCYWCFLVKNKLKNQDLSVFLATPQDIIKPGLLEHFPSKKYHKRSTSIYSGLPSQPCLIPKIEMSYGIIWVWIKIGYPKSWMLNTKNKLQSCCCICFTPATRLPSTLD